MNDLIKRDDAIGACAYETIECYEARKAIRALPSADRPQGDVDAVAILMREMHNLEQGYITIDEFDERIEPLRHLCYGRPQGEWIKDENGDYRCSECGGCEEQFIYGTENWYGRGESNFCPNCGARMKGAE